MTLSTRLTAWFAGLALYAAFAVVSPARAADEAHTLSVRLDWLPTGYHAPFWLAMEKGWFKKAGLDVNISDGTGSITTVQLVGSGQYDVGHAALSIMAIARSKGMKLVSVAGFFRTGDTGLMVPKDSPIKGPQDLKGKTVSVLAYQDTTYYALLGMLAKVGLTKNDVNIEAAGATNVWKLFVANQVDGMASVPDWEVDATSNGATLNVIPADRYFPSMAQAIVASDTTIKEKPELIRKLVAATLRGLADIMQDPEAAAKDYVKAVPQAQGREAQMAQVFRLYDQYVYPGQPKLGVMDPKRLAEVEDFYVKSGIVAKAVPLDELYTNEFVE